MRKTVVIILLFFIFCSFAFASGNFSLNCDLSPLCSFFGAGYSFGQYEFDACLFSGFPMVMLQGYDKSDSFLSNAWTAAKSSCGGVVSAYYDVLSDSKHDLNLGSSVIYSYTSFMGPYLAGTMAIKVSHDINENNGIYLSYDLPLITLNHAHVSTIFESGLGENAVLSLFYARLGYSYHF